jgi:hypothetical protein
VEEPALSAFAFLAAIPATIVFFLALSVAHRAVSFASDRVSSWIRPMTAPLRARFKKGARGWLFWILGSWLFLATAFSTRDHWEDCVQISASRYNCEYVSESLAGHWQAALVSALFIWWWIFWQERPPHEA